MGTKKYTRLDVVEAEPMTFGKFSNRFSGGLDNAYSVEIDGYLVSRAGDPQEWIPKEDFDVEFVATDNLELDRDDIHNAIDKLFDYCVSTTDPLLDRQIQAIGAYVSALLEDTKKYFDK